MEAPGSRSTATRRPSRSGTWRPVGRDIGRVIVRGRADILVDEAGQRALGDVLRLAPQRRLRRARQRPVAGEGELAAGREPGALVDHAADRFRIGRVAHAVQDDLGDRLLALHGLAGGLVVDRLGHAVQGARAVVGVGVQHEGPHRADRQAGEGAQAVDRHGRVGVAGGGVQIGNLAQVQAGPARGAAPEVGAARRRIVPAREVADAGRQLAVAARRARIGEGAARPGGGRGLRLGAQAQSAAAARTLASPARRIVSSSRGSSVFPFSTRVPLGQALTITRGAG